MEAAKQFVSQFTSKRGHKTFVDETVNPAVTFETIKPTRHEITTQAVNREVHQHHYHTTVQPISHREVLPTKHTHNLVPVTHHDHSHKTHDLNLKVKDLHVKELAHFQNRTVTLPTTHTKSMQPAVVGEHVHHHVHEIVQPIIHKETIRPEVVHTSIPIHEVHHQEPIHHTMSELAAIKLEDFNARHRAGHSFNTESYDGAPRPYNKKLTVNPIKYHHKKPAAINTTTTPSKRHTLTTPPLSPVSAASSSGPTTPKHHGATEPGVRNSHDSMPEFDLAALQGTKSPTRTGEIRTTPSIRA